jgi:hypothetical protein
MSWHKKTSTMWWHSTVNHLVLNIRQVLVNLFHLGCVVFSLLKMKKSFAILDILKLTTTFIVSLVHLC